MSKTAFLTIPEGLKHEHVELLLANNETVHLTLDKLYELGLCICHNELSDDETIEYVSQFAQEYIESPL
jgi:predicted metal-dependent TIM-barrel fold hydrolase